MNLHTLILALGGLLFLFIAFKVGAFLVKWFLILLALVLVGGAFWLHFYGH